MGHPERLFKRIEVGPSRLRDHSASAGERVRDDDEKLDNSERQMAHLKVAAT
jgi:hypothetical protein